MKSSHSEGGKLEKGRQGESLQRRILGEICLWQMKSTKVDEIRQVG
jgi:hypothetical protein